MSRVALDLTDPFFTRQFGDVTLHGTWYGESFDESEPCLVLVPSFRRTTEDTVNGPRVVRPPVVILQSVAYMYRNEKANADFLKQKLPVIAMAMGFDASKTRCHKVYEIIESHLDALVMMPPRPAKLTYVGAEAVLTDDHGFRRTAEIIEHV